MDVLGMEKEEQQSLFRTVAGILHFGNIEVKQRPREENATIPTTTGKLKLHSLTYTLFALPTVMGSLHLLL